MPTSLVSVEENEAALFAASKDNSVKTVKNLLKLGVCPVARNKINKTSIEVAAVNQNWDVVEVFIKCKLKPGYYDIPLLMAIKYDNFDIARQLLSQGADLNQSLSKTLDTFLHVAVRNKNANMIELLYRFGADFSKRNKDGLTPYGLATQLKNWNVIDAILEISSFEDEKKAIIKDLDIFRKSWLPRQNKYKANTLIRECNANAKSLEGLIACLKLHIENILPKRNTFFKNSFSQSGSRYQDFLKEKIEKLNKLIIVRQTSYRPNDKGVDFDLSDLRLPEGFSINTTSALFGEFKEGEVSDFDMPLYTDEVEGEGEIDLEPGCPLPSAPYSL